MNALQKGGTAPLAVALAIKPATGDTDGPITVAGETVDAPCGRRRPVLNDGAYVPSLGPVVLGAAGGVVVTAAVALAGPAHHDVATGDTFEDKIGSAPPHYYVA